MPQYPKNIKEQNSPPLLSYTGGTANKTRGNSVLQKTAVVLSSPHEQRQYPLRIKNQNSYRPEGPFVSYRGNNPRLLRTVLHTLLCTVAASRIGHGKRDNVGNTLRHGKRDAVSRPVYSRSRRSTPHKEIYQADKEEKIQKGKLRQQTGAAPSRLMVKLTANTQNKK